MIMALCARTMKSKDKAYTALESSARKDFMLDYHEHCLMQAVADDLDITISSQNGEKSKQDNWGRTLYLIEEV